MCIWTEKKGVQNVGRGREAMRETEGEPLVKPHRPSHRVIGDRKTPNGPPSPALILPIHASQAVAGAILLKCKSDRVTVLSKTSTAF